jgi:PAS domain S-box-containing protein
VDVHRFLVDDGRSRFVVGLLEDITERTLAGQREREREARFREVADGVPVLIWSSGADGIEFVNKAYRDFVGADESDLQGSGWIRYVHPDDRDGYHAAFREATTRQAPFEHQFRLRNVEGYYHWVMSLAVHRYNTRGESTGFIGSMFDIGEFKEAEASLLEADAAKNSFIAMLAHELRNPLASLVNAAQILRTERASPEQRDWAQGVLQRQLTNLTRMVEDLLDISRVTRGKIELRQERVELQSILRAATELFQGNGEADRVSLQVHLPAEPIRIVGDPVRLEQIFNNLLNNAFKFTPDGGAVRLEASIGPDGERPGARVVVTDTGEGIAPEMLSHVFDPFVQGPRPSATSQSGLGIGLALVRRLTELHGGSVTVRSGGIGRGSQFIVSLPLPSERNGD